MKCGKELSFASHRRQSYSVAQLHALRVVGDEFAVGPAGGRDARPQRLDFRLGGDRDRERPDRGGTR
jgi:hypothetical protein